METTLDSKTGWSGMILVRFAHGAWDGASAVRNARNARSARGLGLAMLATPEVPAACSLQSCSPAALPFRGA